MKIPHHLIVRYLGPIFFSCSILALAETAWAHNRVEITGTVGYRFGGRAKVDLDQESGPAEPEGRFIFEDSIAFGGILGYRVNHDGFLYLSYSRQQTTVRYENQDGQTGDLEGKMAIEYYQFGGNLERTFGIFVPYLGASVGFARFLSIGGGADRVFFSPVLDGGMKIDLHEHVHLRLLGRLPIVFSSGDLFCRDGTGCVELDRFSPIVQGEVHGGLGISF